jgi:hypothetical protein
MHTTVERSLLLDRTPDFLELALASYRTRWATSPSRARRSTPS